MTTYASRLARQYWAGDSSSAKRNRQCADLPKLIRLGLADELPHHYGGENDLWEYYALLPHQIAATVKSAVASRQLFA
jgi:hypothetical protein